MLFSSNGLHIGFKVFLQIKLFSATELLKRCHEKYIDNDLSNTGRNFCNKKFPVLSFFSQKKKKICS